MHPAASLAKAPCADTAQKMFQQLTPHGMAFDIGAAAIFCGVSEEKIFEGILHLVRTDSARVTLVDDGWAVRINKEAT